MKMLNSSKGPAVRSLRAQVDKVCYPQEMLKTLNSQENLEIKEAIVDDLLVKDNKVKIKEEHAGLHFLMEVSTKYSDEELMKRIAAKGVHISCLSQYFYDKKKAKKHKK